MVIAKREFLWYGGLETEIAVSRAAPWKLSRPLRIEGDRKKETKRQSAAEGRFIDPRVELGFAGVCYNYAGVLRS